MFPELRRDQLPEVHPRVGVFIEQFQRLKVEKGNEERKISWVGN